MHSSLTHIIDKASQYLHHALQIFIQNIHYPIVAALVLMCLCWLFCTDCFLVILAIFFPPLPVWIRRGLCSIDGFINIALCCLGYIPGLIHSWYIIAHYPEDAQLYEYDYEGQAYYGANGHLHHHHHHHYRDRAAQGGATPVQSNGYAQVSRQPTVFVVTSPANVATTVPVTFPQQQPQQPQRPAEQQPLLQQPPPQQPPSYDDVIRDTIV